MCSRALKGVFVNFKNEIEALDELVLLTAKAFLRMVSGRSFGRIERQVCSGVLKLQNTTNFPFLSSSPQPSEFLHLKNKA